jgi:hypothetical protein
MTTTFENLIQLVFQTSNLLYLGANIGWFSLLSPFSSMVLLIYAIHTYFIIRKLYASEEFYSPMKAYYDKESGWEDRCRNIVQIFASVLAAVAIVLSVVLFMFILAVEQPFNPVWMIQIPDVTSTGKYF